MPSFEPVTAVARAFTILEVLNSLGRASIGDIHKATNLHKSTILRMLETLMHEGYVVRITEGAQYTVSGRCLLLSSGYRAHQMLLRVADPLLAQFRRRIGWPSDIGVFDHDAMIIAATNREFGTMSLNRQVGARVPVLSSSLGRAYLAYLPELTVEHLFDRLAMSSNIFDAQAKNRGKVMKMLRDTRKRGYAVPDPNYTEQVYQNQISGFSVPIFAGEEVIGAVNVMYHSASTSPEHAAGTLLPALISLGEDISRAAAKEHGILN